MPPAAQPVNIATNALGVLYRRVRVEQVVPERGMVIAVDEQGVSTQVPYRVQPGGGRMPREGDYWYLERTLGPWTLASYIATDDADLNRVPGDLDVTGGVSVGGGLYVGGGAHVVGQLHSVTRITTDGTLHGSGNKSAVRTTDTPDIARGNTTIVLSVVVDCVAGLSYEATACWHGMVVSGAGVYPANLYNVTISTSTGAVLASNRLLPSNHSNTQLGGSISGPFTAASTGPVTFRFNFQHESGSVAGELGHINATASAPASLRVRGF